MGGVLRGLVNQVVNTERFIMLIILYRFIDEQCQRSRLMLVYAEMTMPVIVQKYFCLSCVLAESRQF